MDTCKFYAWVEKTGSMQIQIKYFLVAIFLDSNWQLYVGYKYMYCEFLEFVQF